MGRNPDEDWPLDTGNVYLAILSLEMNVVEWIQLTDFEPASGGGMRPWMERHQDQLWISYDRNNKIELVSIQLFEDAFDANIEEPSQEPTSEPDSEPDSEPESENQSKEGGCAGFLLLPIFVLFRKTPIKKRRN